MSASSGSSRPSVASRVLDLLGSFDEEHRRLSLTEIAVRAGLPLSTTHRLVAELVRWGALYRTTSGTYVVGRRIWDIGLLAPVQTGLVEVASPYLQDLYAATRATVHLAVLDSREALYLARVRGTSSVPVVGSVGGRLPLHATGVGKVLLAYAASDVRAAVLAGELRRITSFTITRADQLARQLDQVRRLGWAATEEEMSLGACSLAVPVRRGEDSTVVAALGLVVSSFRRGRGRLLAALDIASRSIGRAVTVRTISV